ncbi:hypothetical protein KKE03_04625 [Patescibacteria group bacterium]|nr:hypothetical protein [Patescibacteria group bacterium]
MVEIFRKTFPIDRGNSKLVLNKPDCPVIVREETWGKLNRFVPGVNRLPDCSGPFTARKVRYGVLLQQTVVVPLTPIIKVSHGGCRVIGGGTSPEALRRAKRKARVNGSR